METFKYQVVKDAMNCLSIMIRLAIIFFLISIVRNEACYFTIDELNELRQLFNDSERNMEEATQGQSRNAAIVIGNGKGGKSTLINYLMGNTLEAYTLGNYDIKIRKADKSTSGPEIGARALSKTSIPSKWNSIRSEYQNLDIWDSAGFMDNRGPKQDFNNSFHLYHLTRKVENLILILLIDYNDIISSNVDQISKMLSILDNYFIHRFKTFFPSVSVIISKVPQEGDNEYPIDIPYICNQLHEQLLLDPQLSISNVSKDFIRHIIDNNQSLAIFRAAEEEGIVTSEIDVNIFPAINSSKRIIKSSHQDIGVPFSRESELCLRHSTADLLSIDILVKLQGILFNSFKIMFNNFCQSNDNNTLLANKAKLNEIIETFNTSLNNNTKAEVKIHVLIMICEDLKNFTKNEDVLNKISLTSFTDFLLRRNKMHEINNVLDSLVKSIEANINSLLSICLRKLNETTSAQYRRKQEENDEIKNNILKSVNNTISKLDVPEEELNWWQRLWKNFLNFFNFD